MSKSLIILTCNFILLCMVTVLHWKMPAGPASSALVAEYPVTPPAGMASETGTVGGPGQPAVLELLKKSLEHEHGLRTNLADRLAATRKTLGETDFRLAQTEETLRARDAALADHEMRLRQSEEKLQRRDQTVKTLEGERASLESQLATHRTNVTELQQRYQITQTSLVELEREHAFVKAGLRDVEQKYLAAQTNVARLQAQIAATGFEANIAEQVISALQEDLRQQVALSAQLQQQLQDGGKSGNKPGATKPAPAPRPVRPNSSPEKPSAATRVPEGPIPADAINRLTRGVDDIQSQSGSSNALGAGAIAFEFNANQVEIVAQGRRAGLFGQSVAKDSLRKTILIQREGFVFAIFHLKDLPIAAERSPVDWQSFTTLIRRGTNVFSILELPVLDQDPRIVLVPIGKAPADKLGVKVFPLATAPAEPGPVVLLGANGNYFAECSFQVDSALRIYAHMDRTKFSRPSGKVQPERGDLVLNSAGAVLGIMVNREYCLVLDDLSTSRMLRTGQPLEQQPAPLLTEVQRRIASLPAQLQ